jgi:hypothetical protein
MIGLNKYRIKLAFNLKSTQNLNVLGAIWAQATYAKQDRQLWDTKYITSSTKAITK